MRADNYTQWLELGWCLHNIDYRLITDQAKEILGFNPIDHNKTLKDTAEYIDSF